MARLYLFAEGQTEQTFADEVIKPHLAEFGVYLQNAVLIANARRRGKALRGGGRSYLAMRNDIRRFLKQEPRDDVFFTTMIDLYALHPDFPGRDEAEPLRHDPRRRVEALEASFAGDVGDRRFVPYIQLHEFEAVLFCDPGAFGTYFERAGRGIESLRRVVERFDTPEEIDDGPQTAPSKRILEAFPEYKKAKATAGPILARCIGLDAIRQKCPHFHGWMTRLESLVGGSEPSPSTS
jgi:hypothetical protein